MKFCCRILLTVYDTAVFYLGLAWFGVICLSWTLIALVLQVVMPRESGRRLGRLGIMYGFRLFLSSLELSGRFKFDLRALDALRDENALVIAPNHPSLWDVVLVGSRLPDVACVMKAEIVGNLFLGAGARLARYIHNQSLRQMIVLAIADLQRGSHVLLFPEGTRTVGGPIGPLKGAIGIIAHRAAAPVQTVFIETDSPFLTKGWPVHKMPPLPMHYRIRLGQRFDPPTDSATLMTALEQYFLQQLAVPEALQSADMPAPLPENAPAFAE